MNNEKKFLEKSFEDLLNDPSLNKKENQFDKKDQSAVVYLNIAKIKATINIIATISATLFFFVLLLRLLLLVRLSSILHLIYSIGQFILLIKKPS